MSLIFDTSILIDLDRGRPEIIAKIHELRKMYSVPARISFITHFEFLMGIKEKIEKNKEKSMIFIDRFGVLQTTRETARHLFALKSRHELPLADLIIAAQVLESGDVLVTKDKDFEKITEIEKIIL